MVAAGKICVGGVQYKADFKQSCRGLKGTGMKVPSPECEVPEVNMTKLMHGWLILLWENFTIGRKKKKRNFSEMAFCFSVSQKSCYDVEPFFSSERTVSICMFSSKLTGPAEVTDRSQGKDRLPDVREQKTCEVLIRKCHFISWLSFKTSFSLYLS